MFSSELQQKNIVWLYCPIYWKIIWNNDQNWYILMKDILHKHNCKYLDIQICIWKGFRKHRAHTCTL